MDKLMFKMRETNAFAYCLGTCEALRFGDCADRTHRFNQRWNEAYEAGTKLAESVSYCFSEKRKYVVLAALCWIALAVFFFVLAISVVLMAAYSSMMWFFVFIASIGACWGMAALADKFERLASDAHYRELM